MPNNVNPLFPLALVAGYLLLCILWVMRGYPMIERRFIAWLERALGGVRIVKRMRGRTQNWEIGGENPPTGKSCLLSLIEVTFTFGCLAMPLFGLLLLLGLILFAASGEFSPR